MYKRIFLPTDGSKLSGKAVKAGIALAQSLDASVTIFHVYPEFRYLVDEGYLMPGTEEIRQRYEAQARQHTRRFWWRPRSSPKMPGCRAAASRFQATVFTKKSSPHRKKRNAT
jgi:nucleotide-binding universal stress UspA family protein